MSMKFNGVTMDLNDRPSIDDLNDIIGHHVTSDDQFCALVKASTEFDESTVEAFAAACAAWVKADFNARFPGASGPEPVRCEFCGGDLPRLRAHVCHCSEDCWREWQREQDNR